MTKICGVLFLEINDKVKILMPSKKRTNIKKKQPTSTLAFDYLVNHVFCKLRKFKKFLKKKKEKNHFYLKIVSVKKMAKQSIKND